MRILIAEDEARIARFMERGLKANGYATTVVEDGISALDLASGGEFDATPYVGTLENEGVGLAPYHDLEDKVSSELQDEVDALRQDIIDGEVAVESDASPEAA